MKIRTSRTFNVPREQLWPLLTKSRMDVPGWFCLGLPRPVSCELPQSFGGVGSERRCISDRGTVIQMITNWQPPDRLQFRMISTDHAWGPCVESLEEDFRLEQSNHGTRITRTTSIKATGWIPRIKEVGFYLGLKRVHRYVFDNWRATTEGTDGKPPDEAIQPPR